MIFGRNFRCWNLVRCQGQYFENPAYIANETRYNAQQSYLTYHVYCCIGLKGSPREGFLSHVYSILL